MDNPNTYYRLRRHNTLSSKLQRPCAFLKNRLRMKTNPYVGSFRHAPPTTFRSMQASELSVQRQSLSLTSSSTTTSTSLPLKNSPYIGWFRHAPPTGVELHTIDQQTLSTFNRFQQLAFIIENLAPREKIHPGLSEMINGRLVGGGKDKRQLAIQPLDSAQFIKSVHDALQETSEESSSSTVKILAKLGTWFLLPLTCDPEPYGYTDKVTESGLQILPEIRDRRYESESESDDDDDDDEDSESDYESDECSVASVELSDFDTCQPASTSSTSQTPKPLNLSLSEIAEAYHAHQEIDQSEYAGYEGHRLDYVITQMDIARMARNASRHLDVDSILNLPTVVYRSPETVKETRCCTSVGDSRDPDEGWSFIMVPQDKSISQKQQISASKSKSSTGEEKPGSVCVICLEHFVDGDRLRVLPCDHSFHVGCIDRWLSGSHSHHECFTSGCPTCKERPSLDLAPSSDGSVPSWAFSQLGNALARSSSS